MANDIKKELAEFLAIKNEMDEAFESAPIEIQAYNALGNTSNLAGELLDMVSSMLDECKNFDGNAEELKELIVDAFPQEELISALTSLQHNIPIIEKLESSLSKEAVKVGNKLDKLTQKAHDKREALEKKFSIEELNTAFAEVV